MNAETPAAPRLRPPMRFPPFLINFENQQLFRGSTEIGLRPRTWSVLSYLAQRPGLLVSKHELLDAVWPSKAISEVTLSTSISEIRQALGDRARSPRFLATVHGRGFRFIADIQSAYHAPVASGAEPTLFVGRERESLTLRKWLSRANEGQRTIGFVHGEMGIGKTELIRQVIDDTRADHLVGLGQCVESLCQSEDFGPILQALASLAAGAGRERVLDALSQHAPSWLIRIPSLATSLSEESRQELEAKDRGDNPGLLGWQLAEALEALSAQVSVTLWIEDLHWADEGTWNVLELLARRPSRARLLMIASHRSPSHGTRGDRLRRRKPELATGFSGRDLALEALGEEDVDSYLSARCPGLPGELAGDLHDLTDGNALFLICVLDQLIESGEIEPNGLDWAARAAFSPRNLEIPRQLLLLLRNEIESLDRLARAVLEAASVAGRVFGMRSVAVALDLDPGTVEEICEELAYHQILRRERPRLGADGSSQIHYAFKYELRRHAVYRQIPASRRTRHHHAVAGNLSATASLR